MQLTQNFRSEEFDVPEPWPASKASERAQLAQLLQWFRDLFGVPGIITSGWRSPAHNLEIGGATHSEHMDGRAVDIVFRGISDQEATRRLLDAEARGQAPAYGQFITYDLDSHLHISLPRSDGRVNRQKLRCVAPGLYKTIAKASDVPKGIIAAPALWALALVGVALAFFSHAAALAVRG